MAKKTDDTTEKAKITPLVPEPTTPENALPDSGKSETVERDSPVSAGQDVTGTSSVEAVPEAEAEADPTPEVVLQAPGHDPQIADLVAPVHDPRDEFDGDAATFGAEIQDDPAEDLVAPEPEFAAAAPEPTAEQAPQQVIVKRGGFVPALLGGVVAAGIGFAGALALYPEGAPFMSGGDPHAALQKQLDAQAAAIAELKSSTPAAPDLSALEATSASLEAMKGDISDLSAAADKNTADLSNLNARLTAIEKRPVETGVSQSAIDAYEGELSKLQQAMQDQRGEIEDMISQAEEMKADAAATARDTQIRAALVRIGSSLDAGDPYEAPLDTLSGLGLTIPAELSAHSGTGVVTLARLRDDFPEYARKTLAATRDAGETSSITAFFKTQLGARSLNPRDGDDPDAVLSRAEGKLRDGQLGDALSELDTLPDAAKSVMQPWIDMASTRAEAVTAQKAMSADFKTN